MNMASEIADVNNIEAVTEMATQILLVNINKLEKVSVTQLYLLDFTYDATIEKIYMDISGKLKKGDSITVTSPQGIIKGTEFVKLAKNSKHAQKYGYANREYTENDYIISSVFDGIPIEEGKKYIMYLSDDYLEKYSVYPDIGRMYLYEYTYGVLYKGSDYIKMNVSIKELEAQISKDIKNRTGRADEIGVDAYIDELGELQRKARAEKR